MEILGVEKFGNLQILEVAKFLILRNFVGCQFLQPAKFLQVANFRNLRNFAGCQFSQPANTAHTCTYYLLFDPLVGGFIYVFPYVILIL